MRDSHRGAFRLPDRRAGTATPGCASVPASSLRSTGFSARVRRAISIDFDQEAFRLARHGELGAGGDWESASLFVVKWVSRFLARDSLQAADEERRAVPAIARVVGHELQEKPATDDWLGDRGFDRETFGKLLYDTGERQIILRERDPDLIQPASRSELGRIRINAPAESAQFDENTAMILRVIPEVSEVEIARARGRARPAWSPWSASTARRRLPCREM